MHVLGALLLADGEKVTPAELAAGLFPWVAPVDTIKNHVFNLRRFGVEIASKPHHGYWLLRIPADEHLESLLAVLPLVKRSEWWVTRSTSQTQRTA